jgi:glycosyltransferase involved in cell wall biosynthesis
LGRGAESSTVRAVTPAVSVVIPTHDRKNLLLLAIRSVLRQRGVEVEVIVVDDGSTDGSWETVRSINDPRIRILHHGSSLGVATARNAGAAAAVGSWIAFLDDDDLWSPHKLSEQLSAAERAETSWVYAGAVAIDLHGRLLAGDPPPSPESLVSELPRRNLMPAGSSNVMIRATDLISIGGFDPALRHLADWDLWLRMASVSGPALANKPLVGYRIHPTQATLDTTGMIEEASVLSLRHGADRASIYRWLAWSHLRQGRRNQAIRAYGRAVSSGDFASIGRMVIAAAHPRPTSLRRRGSSPESLDWQREAEEWLGGLSRD